MVRFPPPEAEIVRVLTASLPGVQVANQHPDHLDGAFIRVTARGGARRDLALSQRLMQIYAYEETHRDAAHLIEDALAAIMSAGRSGDEKVIRSVSIVAEPNEYPDPDTGKPRYAATVAVLLRGVPS